MAVSVIVASPRRPPVADVLAACCAMGFVVILALSAYWDPTIRVLHVFEALPYLAAAFLSLRQRKLGYVLGTASGAFWLWMAATQTSFVRNGFEQLATLVRTGRIDRADVLIAAPAACFTGGLALFSLAGYFRLRNKSRKDVLLFALAFLAIAAYFAGMFAAFAPRYLALFQRLFQR
jgi:hypothetical protein